MRSGETARPSPSALPRRPWPQKIGFVPEDRLSEGPVSTQSIADNIIISEIDQMKTGKGTFDYKLRQETVDKWVKDLAIATPDPNNNANTLSGGNQQRIVLAKWLATNPEVLILNGPTVGVDHRLQARYPRHSAEAGPGTGHGHHHHLR